MAIVDLLIFGKLVSLLKAWGLILAWWWVLGVGWGLCVGYILPSSPVCVWQGGEGEGRRAKGTYESQEEAQPLCLLSPQVMLSPRDPNLTAPPRQGWGAAPNLGAEPSLGTEPRRPQGGEEAELCLGRAPGLEMAPGKGSWVEKTQGCPR